VLPDAIEGLPVGGVPGIEVRLLGELSRMVQGVLVHTKRDLLWAVVNAQDVDRRRMDLAENDDVSRFRRVHKGALAGRLLRAAGLWLFNNAQAEPPTQRGPYAVGPKGRSEPFHQDELRCRRALAEFPGGYVFW